MLEKNKVKQGPTTKARKLGAITDTALQSTPMAPPASPTFPRLHSGLAWVTSQSPSSFARLLPLLL